MASTVPAAYIAERKR